MPEGLITALHAVGVPVAIISALAITILMRTVSAKLSIAGGIITLAAVTAYIPIDLVPKARDAWGQTEIHIDPDNFLPFLTDMSPTSVSIVAKRGETDLRKINIPAPDKTYFENRKIVLKRKPKEEAFVAKLGATTIGVVTDTELESRGFSPTPQTGQFIGIANSKRVYVGDSWSVSNTPLGKLKLTFVTIKNGKVLLQLYSSNYGVPHPETIEIANKQFDIQSFEGKYEVTVQVREADFNVKGEEWAAFTVIIS